MAERKVLKPAQYKAIALMIYKDVNGLTNEDIAREIGVNASTIYEWKKKDYFNRELLRQAEEVQKSFLADTYTQLRMIINNNNVKSATKLKAIELLLRNQGRLKDVQEVTQVVEDKNLDELLSELDNI